MADSKQSFVSDGDDSPDVPTNTAGISSDPNEDTNADIDDKAVHIFWEKASKALGFSDLSAIIGNTTTAGAIQPPPWKLATDAAAADALAHEVLAGTKKMVMSVKADYDAAGAPLPEVYQMNIICDGSGIPRVLVRTDRVSVLPFDEVDEKTALLEGEEIASLNDWREAHLGEVTGSSHKNAALNAESDIEWPHDDVVVEQFTRIYPLEDDE